MLKYGLIPEFVGRLPVVAALDELDAEALVRIICEPKNALLRQFQKLFEMDGVELEITEDGLEAIARRSQETNTGARGLRTTLEELLMDTMFTLPSKTGVKKVVVNRETVDSNSAPILVTQPGHAEAQTQQAEESA